MRLHARIVTLEYLEPFVISRSADTSSEVVQVAIEHDGLVGYGEGAPDEHYDEGPSSARDWILEHVGARLGDDPLATGAILDRLGELPGQMAAKCAVDGASARPAREDLRPAAVADPRPRPHAAADELHHLDRHARGHRRPGRAGVVVQGAQDQGGRPGRPGAGADRARGGAQRARQGRRERGVDGRVDPRSGARARASRRGARRAAAAGGRPRRLRPAACRPSADPDRGRRELPHARRRGAGRGRRRRRQHQADQVGRDPRGAAG